MAQRRSSGGGFNFANPVITMLMQHLLTKKRAEEDDARQMELTKLSADLASQGRTQQQGIDTAQQMVPGLLNGATKPGSMPPDLLSKLGLTSSDAVNLAPQNDTRPDIETLLKAKTQADVPSFESMVSGVAGRGAGIRDLGPLNELGRLREQRLSDIGLAQEGEMNRGFAQASGNAYNAGQGANRAKNENFPAELQQALQSGQQANNLAQQNAQAMIPIDVQHQTELNPVLAARAGGIETATQNAALAPELVNKRVNEYLRAHPPDPTNPTDAQARAAGMFPILQDADKILRGFEDKRIDVGAGSLFMSDQPLANRFMNSDQQSLIQGAKAYTNVASLILTGVQARPDEYTRFLSSYVGSAGDDDRVRNQKRLARQKFTESVIKRAQTGQPAASLTEIMDQADAVSGGVSVAAPSYPGEPAPLPDGIGSVDPVTAARDRLENLRRGR